MAGIIQKQYAKVGGVFVEEYMSSHIKGVVGLLDGEKIARGILPAANDLQLGAVKLSHEFDGTALGQDVAFTQPGAKTLYDTLIAKIRNLESPIDYIASLYPDPNWSGSTSISTINTTLNNFITNTAGVQAIKAGAAVMVYNNSTWEYTGNGVSQEVTGYWLWVYDGFNSSWVPTIDFPDVPRASYTKSTQAEMTEGIITQEMLWKLKNIGAGANVISVAGETGVVVLNKTHVGLSNVNDTADANKNVLSATKLTTARTIAGVSFNGTANIAIPFDNLTDKPTTLDGYKISDAQPLDADLTAIANLPNDGLGRLRKIGNGSWDLDTTPYITGITKTMVETVLTGTITSHTHSSASESAKGIIELATSAEALAATDTERATTPARVKDMINKFGSLKMFAAMPALADVEDGQVFLVQQLAV